MFTEMSAVIVDKTDVISITEGTVGSVDFDFINTWKIWQQKIALE
jgi:hypothetical protein